MVEVRDLYTSGHQKRVASLAIAIANELNLSRDRIGAIDIAAQIHDIGKINIPDSILSKPARLSDIEYSMIKTHCQVGHDLIKTIDFEWPIADMILQHHERIDGSGYPEGKKGKDILLESKILGVADVVEAMSSHRPYRPALGIKKALVEIIKGSSRLYDPEVVDACVDLINKNKFKLN